MAVERELEHVVLRCLRLTPQSRAGLVRRTGSTDLRMQELLDSLIADTFVVRRPHSAGALYELTEYGTGRLHLLDQLAGAKAEAAKAANPPPRVRRPPWVPVAPKQPPPVEISETQRLESEAALTKLYAEDRISRRQLSHGRTGILLARTQADLDAVVQLLASTPLPRRRMSVWQWIGWRILGGPRPQ